MRCLSFILLGLGWMMMNGLAATTPTPRVGEGVVLKPVLATQVPHMDGVLDDPVWQGAGNGAGYGSCTRGGRYFDQIHDRSP